MSRVAISCIIGAAILLGVTYWSTAEPTKIGQKAEVQVTPADIPTPPTEIKGDDFGLGEYYFNQDEDPSGPYNLTLARYYYQRAVRSNPVPETAWYQLGRIEFALGNFEASKKHLHTQLEKFGDAAPQVYYGLGLTNGYQALETNDPAHWSAAEEAFQAFIEYAPESPWPRVDLAWVYFSQGKYEQMIPHLETALQYNPQQAWVLNTYGLALLNIRDRQAAHSQFKQAEVASQRLTVTDWAAAYTGNDPNNHAAGLQEFQQIVATNLKLTE